MNQDWLQSNENAGVNGAGNGADNGVEGDGKYSPEMVAIRSDYRWTPACQRAFLEELACTGSVTRATWHVAKSARSAYILRYRSGGMAFRLGWDAAILIARATLADMLLDRAINGYQEMSVRGDDGTTVRSKYDHRLGQGLLNRLDRIAEAQAAKNSVVAQVQLICQDFERFLDLIGNGGQGAETALFFAARDDKPMPEMRAAVQCELDRISADALAVPDQTDLSDLHDIAPEAAAARLSVWYDPEEEQWKTNFPVCEADAADVDADLIIETGQFGDEDYERSLSVHEEEAHRRVRDADMAPLRAAALQARAQWFGLKAAA